MTARLWKKPEPVEYEPRSVKELLTEMKDLSELIIDLAYSAVIFNSKEMAKEVGRLEKRMDKLLYLIRINTLLASRTVKNAEKLSGLLQVAAATENVSNAAGDIIDLLETGIEHRPFLPSFFKEADEKIKLLKVPDGSEVVGRSLEELCVESETGVKIIAIKRGKRWIYDPQGGFVLKKEDLLIVRGVEDGYRKFKRWVE